MNAGKTPEPTRTLAGACQCGAVTYRVVDQFVFAVNCHCSICRRATGAAFNPIAGIERSKLQIASGQDSILIVNASTWHDERCRRCGSLLFAVVRAGTFVHVAMGTLLDDSTIRPSAHIFVGSKAPWFSITDDLPQHDGHARNPEELSIALRRGQLGPEGAADLDEDELDRLRRS